MAEGKAMSEFLPFSRPAMGVEELAAVKEVLESGWITTGPKNQALEQAFCQLTGNQHAIAVSSATAGMHITLMALKIGKGDEVITPSLTWVSTLNMISLLGATPVMVDVDRDTLMVTPEAIESAITPRTKAIIPVHLYGMPAQIETICRIASKYNIPVLEDAAEAIGSEYKGQKCGTFGEFGALSFNGNKMITTSGGGALICRTEEAAKRTVFLATQARENRPYYYHETIGYNYRLSNICAGIGRGQMLVLDAHIARRRAIHKLYTELFSDTEGIRVKQNPGSDYDANFWLTCIEVEPSLCNGKTADDIRQYLEQHDIESRLLWRPMHMQPVFAQNVYYGNGVAEHIFNRGLCLPSGSSLTDEQIFEVASMIKIFCRSR